MTVIDTTAASFKLAEAHVSGMTPSGYLNVSDAVDCLPKHGSALFCAGINRFRNYGRVE